MKIYGTDIDDDALQSARRASYPAAAIDAVPDEFRDKYFEKVDDRFVFRPQLRSSMVFGHLDVLRDAPISRLEMLACRNTLMYFNAETQAQVIARFHFALNEGGLLMVGKAETLLSHGDLFKPFDRKLRVFRRVTGSADPDGHAEGLSVRVAPAASRDAITLPASFFDVLSVAALLFDANGVLVEMSERARSVFGFTSGERGTLLQDLELSYRPIDLRTPVNQVLRERRPTTLSPVEWTAAGGALRTFEIEIVPLLDGRVVVGAGLVFHDRTEHQRVEDKLKLSAVELEQAYQAVQSANEELETTNEELQSTIEELETTNEELQSTNEELETTNEELHSTNDELHSVNEEVRLRGDQVDALNRFLQAILTSVRGGVVLIDSGRRVLAWNDQAADLWGLRQDEVTGSDFFSLDIGLPTAELRPALRATLEGLVDREQVEVEAVDRRGRPVRVRVSLTPLRTDDAPLGAMLTMQVLPEGDPQ